MLENNKSNDLCQVRMNDHSENLVFLRGIGKSIFHVIALLKVIFKKLTEILKGYFLQWPQHF